MPTRTLESIITYLQMSERPGHTPRLAPRDDLSIVEALRPTVTFYRFLYHYVGRQWYWLDRLRWSDEELLRELHSPGVELHVLYAAGVPAGYVELDFRDPRDVELRYFGICDDFTGQKLGPHLLDWAIDRVWSRQPGRFWLHTCTLDHPAALGMYQRAGFQPYDQKSELVEVPEAWAG